LFPDPFCVDRQQHNLNGGNSPGDHLPALALVTSGGCDHKMVQVGREEFPSADRQWEEVLLCVLPLPRDARDGNGRHVALFTEKPV
jgi:hypothetical protein